MSPGAVGRVLALGLLGGLVAAGVSLSLSAGPVWAASNNCSGVTDGSSVWVYVYNGTQGSTVGSSATFRSPTSTGTTWQASSWVSEADGFEASFAASGLSAGATYDLWLDSGGSAVPGYGCPDGVTLTAGTGFPADPGPFVPPTTTTTAAPTTTTTAAPTTTTTGTVTGSCGTPSAPCVVTLSNGDTEQALALGVAVLVFLTSAGLVVLWRRG